MSNSSSVRQSVGRFVLGRLSMTRGTQAALPEQSILDCFRRHARGDFGDVCNEDFEANLDALSEGLRILSVYHCDNKHGDRTKVYVITEADRSTTTVLLAEEY